MKILVFVFSVLFVWPIFSHAQTDVPLPQDGRYASSFNPDISLIIGGEYQDQSGEKDAEPFGFEAELFITSNVDPYFKAWVTLGFAEEEAEVEEAVIQTASLPYQLQIKTGKFFSETGRVNSQHFHSWDFADRPLINELLFGEEGLNDTGAQVSWLAPMDFYLLTGVEVFQGNNENTFQYVGAENLPEKSGPRVFAGWLKFAPELDDANSAVQFGVSFGRGIHQENLDLDADNLLDRWLDGHSWFAGADIVYKYDDNRAYGRGDIAVQGEFFVRGQNLSVVNDTLNPGLEGIDADNTLNGYYIQASYGFLPRWNAGLRWDQVNGESDSIGNIYNITASLGCRLSEFSLLRLQYETGRIEAGGESENVSSMFLQIQVSLGAHGAHKF